MNGADLRLTQTTLKVLRIFLAEFERGRSGAEISKLAKVGSGTLYPMLARLEKAGWLSSEWEDIEPSEVGRPRRRFYKLTGNGQKNVHAAFRELQLAPGELAWTS